MNQGIRKFASYFRIIDSCFPFQKKKCDRKPSSDNIHESQEKNCE